MCASHMYTQMWWCNRQEFRAWVIWQAWSSHGSFSFPNNLCLNNYIQLYLQKNVTSVCDCSSFLFPVGTDIRKTNKKRSEISLSTRVPPLQVLQDVYLFIVSFIHSVSQSFHSFIFQFTEISKNSLWGKSSNSNNESRYQLLCSFRHQTLI